MDPLRPFRRNRPRLGCVALAVLAVPCLSCSIGYFISAIPEPDPMPREAVMSSYAAEEEVATSMGFVLADAREEQTDDAAPERIDLSLGASECVAVIGAVWGHQQLTHLQLSRGGGGPVLTSSSPEGRVAHVQWCTDDPVQLRAELQRRAKDLYLRNSSGGLHVGIYRASSARIGGVRALRRGIIAEEGLDELGAHVFEAADHERTAGRELGGPFEIASMSARLVPEDRATYAELYRGALNGTHIEVDPRFTPLPPDVRADWRPGATVGVPRTIEQLRAQLHPDAHPSELHPAVRDSDGGFVRVLAILDADRLGARCVDVQLVRMRFGERASVRRARAGREELRDLRSTDNAALDRVCVGQGTLVYVAAADDQQPYTLRLDRAE